MYVGAISGVIGAFLYEQSCGSAAMNGFLAIAIPLLASLCGSLLMGLLYCFLTVTLRANQNVTGLAMTTFGVGFGNFFGGSLIKLTGSEVPSIALSATSQHFSRALPFASKLGWFGKIFFLSYGFPCLRRCYHRPRRVIRAQSHARGPAPARRRRKPEHGRRRRYRRQQI